MIRHRFGPFSFQRGIFERITCPTDVLDVPLTAAGQSYSARRPALLFLPRINLYNPSACPGGEIGRRKGLKIPRPKGHAGSIPAPGTNFEKT